MPVKLSIVIVSYNSGSFIEKCINSVVKNLPAETEVIVLDNASTDKTAEILEKFSRIKLIKSPNNLGYSKGNNRAVNQADGEYLFFLNPDTEISNPVFEELIKFYEQAEDAGIVAPKLIMSDGGVQPSVRRLPTVLGAFEEYVLGMKNKYSQYVPEEQKPVEVEMVYGAAMLIKKDLFEKMGGFDEKYFLYYEDADLCKMVQKAGKKIYYYPKVSITHLVGATESQLDKEMLNNKSSLKYHGLVGSLFLKIIFFIHRITNRLTNIFSESI